MGKAMSLVLTAPTNIIIGSIFTTRAIEKVTNCMLLSIGDHFIAMSPLLSLTSGNVSICGRID